MGWLTRLFGYEGTVRFRAETLDGRFVTGKVHISTIGMSKQEIESKLINILCVHTGTRFKSVTIVAME